MMKNIESLPNINPTLRLLLPFWTHVVETLILLRVFPGPGFRKLCGCTRWHRLGTLGQTFLICERTKKLFAPNVKESIALFQHFQQEQARIQQKRGPIIIVHFAV